MSKIKFTIYALTFLLGFTLASSAHAAITIRPMLNTGLVGYWSMDEGSGNVVNDQSGNGNTGIMTQMDPATDWVDGKLGKALDFDGSNDYVLVDSSGIFDSQYGTWSFWMKTDGTWGTNGDDPDNSAILMSRVDADCGKNGLNISVGNQAGGGNVWFETKYGIDCIDPNYGIVNGGGSNLNVLDDQWHHVAVTYSRIAGENSALYIDGSQGATGTNTASWSFNNQVLGISASIQTWWEEFGGKIDDVRIYNRALSAGEITRLYNLTKPKILSASDSGLVGYWSFDEGTGSKAGDMSGRGNNGLLFVNFSTQTFTSTGFGTSTAPAGADLVQVEAWGGGGNGAPDNNGAGNNGGGGGGGGAYARLNSYPVNPGTDYPLYVGSASTASYWISPSVLFAAAGATAPGVNGGAGGNSASCVGDVKTNGNDGDAGWSEYWCEWDDYCGCCGCCVQEGWADRGGVGGSGAGGGSGGAETSPGSQPGGGGGGGTSPANAGAGAPGQIILTYADVWADGWANGKRGKALEFDGTYDYIKMGSLYNSIKAVSFWLKADDITSRKIMDFDGTDQIEINGSSRILATSFPGATVIYIDGVATSTIDANWHFVTITDTTGVNGSAVNIGRVGLDYFDGKLDEVRIYNRALSATEVAGLYNASKKVIKVNAPQNNMLTTGLVGMWTFNGQDMINGTTARDITGNGYVAYLLNGAKLTSGRVGQGLTFDAVDDVVWASTTSIGEGSALTVSAWVRFNNPTNNVTKEIVTKDKSAAGQHQWTLFKNRNNATGALTFDVYNSSDVLAGAQSDNPWPTDTGWHHVVGLYDGANVYVYGDGVSLDTTPPALTGSIKSYGNYVCFGGEWTGATCSSAGGGYQIDGDLDEVRIYGRALTAGEINRLYRMGK